MSENSIKSYLSLSSQANGTKSTPFLTHVRKERNGISILDLYVRKERSGLNTFGLHVRKERSGLSTLDLHVRKG